MIHAAAIQMTVLWSSLVVGQYTDLGTLFDAREKNFGNVAFGSVSVHVFKVKNTTGSTLRITNLKSTCKCAIPSAPKFEAKAGEELSIEVKYDARTFTGSRSMVIDVTFEQPVVQVVQLRISGFSRADVMFSPGELEFGVVTKKTNLELASKLDHIGGGKFEIQELLKTTYFDVVYKEPIRDGNKTTYEFKVKPKADAPFGQLAEAIVLKTNDVQTPQIQLIARMTKEPPIRVTPDILDFGVVAVGQSSVKKALVRADEPFNVETVVEGIKGVSVRSSEGVKTTHVLDIEFKPEKAGKFEETLKVRTSLKDESPISIKLTGQAQ